MKKWTKAWLAVGAGCCICGAVLTGIGILSGGRNYVSAADLNRMDGSAKKEDQETFLAKTKIDNFDSVNVQLTSMSLQVVASDDDSCYISYQAGSRKGDKPVNYQVKDNTLELKETDSDKTSYFHVDIGFLSSLLGDGQITSGVSYEDLVTLYIPEGKVWKQTDLTTETGDVLLNECQMENGTIETDSGDIYIKHCDFQNLAVNSDLGDVQIIDSDKKMKTWAIQADTDIGDLNIDNALDGKLLENDSDDTEVYLQEGIHGKLQIQTDSGDIRLKCE